MLGVFDLACKRQDVRDIYVFNMNEDYSDITTFHFIKLRENYWNYIEP